MLLLLKFWGRKGSSVAYKLCTALVLMLGLNAASAQATGLDGRWNMPGEKPGEISAIIRLEPSGSGADPLYRGILEMISVAPGEEPNPKCDKCTGTNKGQPLKGLEVLTGLKRAATSGKGEVMYQDGKVLDPESGKTYRCKLVLSADGKSLSVTYYLGLLSHTEVWTRATNL